MRRYDAVFEYLIVGRLHQNFYSFRIEGTEGVEAVLLWYCVTNDE